MDLTAFIQGCQILDSILIGHEITHSLNTRKIEGQIFKVNFEKAFDCVNWEFLFSSLTRMKFSGKWLNLLRVIFNSTRLSVLINGSPTQEFSPGRGLRQGDPLSPLLFLIVGEVLHWLLEEACSMDIMQGVCYSKSGKRIFHLQFTDDTVIFIQRNYKSVVGVKRVL